MVELIDDDVVERGRFKLIEMPAEGLHGGKEDVGVR